jgi:hypothetical protein
VSCRTDELLLVSLLLTYIFNEIQLLCCCVVVVDDGSDDDDDDDDDDDFSIT